MIFISARLAKLFAQAASGALQVDTILILLGLKSIGNLVFILPVSFYLAILLALSRLHKDNEMAALAACGIGQGRVMRSVLVLALFFAGIAALFTLYLAPWAEQQTERIAAQVQASSDIKGITAGRFKQLVSGIGATYVQELNEDKSKMKNIFIQKQLKDRQITITAGSGYQYVDKETGDEFLALQNGYRYEGQAGQNDYTIVEYENHGVRVYEREVKNISYRIKAVLTAELWRSKGTQNMIELQWRISTVILCIILAVLAVPLSRTSPRQGQYAKLTLAILIYISYTNLLNVSRVWLDKGELPLYLGLWWVHGAMLIVGLLIMFNQTGIRHFFKFNRKTSVDR